MEIKKVGIVLLLLIGLFSTAKADIIKKAMGMGVLVGRFEYCGYNTEKIKATVLPILGEYAEDGAHYFQLLEAYSVVYNASKRFGPSTAGETCDDMFLLYLEVMQDFNLK